MSSGLLHYCCSILESLFGLSALELIGVAATDSFLIIFVLFSASHAILLRAIPVREVGQVVSRNYFSTQCSSSFSSLRLGLFRLASYLIRLPISSGTYLFKSGPLSPSGRSAMEVATLRNFQSRFLLQNRHSEPQTMAVH